MTQITHPTRFARAWLTGLSLVLAATAAAPSARATIHGIEGMSSGSTRSFHLAALPGHISLPDGSSLLMWGYSDTAAFGDMQVPGPTLLVNEGDTVTVTLDNALEVPTSAVFPGQSALTATGGVAGLLTREAPPGGTVEYTFRADRAGTYLYSSGTRPDLQVEMGLVGAIVVRPAVAGRAYAHPDTAFDREFLFVLSEIDPNIHELAERGRLAAIDTTAWWPTIWLINGRAAPDTMAPAFAPWLPNQPYDALPAMHPGERLLIRFVGANRDLHPFHTHGNHSRIIARDGRLLESTLGAGPDLSEQAFTVTVAPGQTVDALFEWTGADLGWDIYGHDAADPLEPGESAADHGLPFPFVPRETQELTFGPFWSGSPFLGHKEGLPPGNGTMSMNGGYFYMWHSHNEREMVTYDVFPGGMMTMLLIEHPDVPLP